MPDDEVPPLPLTGPVAAEMANLYSLHRDLEYVAATCRYLIAHPPVDYLDQDGHLVGRALWESAVISYARCFDTATGHIIKGTRRPEAPTDRLTPLQRHLHDDVLVERNRFVAHRSDLVREQPQITARDTGQGVAIRVGLQTQVIASANRAERLAANADVVAAQLTERIHELRAAAVAYIEAHPTEVAAARRDGRELSIPHP